MAGWLLWAANKQRQLMAEASGGFTAAVSGQELGRVPSGGWNLIRLGGAGLLLLAAGAQLGLYRHLVGVEQGHLDRAVTVAARIASVDDVDYSITVEVPSELQARPRVATIGVTDTAPYHAGETTPVQVDPTSRTWIRLVAEPQDVTYWETGGLLALAFVVLLGLRELEAHRARSRLWTGEHPAIAVRTMRDARHTLVFTAAGPKTFDRSPAPGAYSYPATPGGYGYPPAPGGYGYPPAPTGYGYPFAQRAYRVEVPIAKFSVATVHPRVVSAQPPAPKTPEPSQEPDQAAAVTGVTWQAVAQAFPGQTGPATPPAYNPWPYAVPAVPAPAVMLGSLRHGGWVLLITEESTVLPKGPLRVQRMAGRRLVQ